MEGERAKSNVLSLGQCAADGYALARLIEDHFHATVVPAATAEEASRLLAAGRFALILVNRILDANGVSGLDCLIRFKKEADEIPSMLVSNHASAQQEAQALGALPGFGKAALHDPRTLARLAATLEPRSAQG